MLRESKTVLPFTPGELEHGWNNNSQFVFLVQLTGSSGWADSRWLVGRSLNVACLNSLRALSLKSSPLDGSSFGIDLKGPELGEPSQLLLVAVLFYTRAAFREGGEGICQSTF